MSSRNAVTVRRHEWTWGLVQGLTGNSENQVTYTSHEQAFMCDALIVVTQAFASRSRSDLFIEFECRSVCVCVL
jgi:hypothetical protein